MVSAEMADGREEPESTRQNMLATPLIESSKPNPGRPGIKEIVAGALTHMQADSAQKPGFYFVTTGEGLAKDLCEEGLQVTEEELSQALSSFPNLFNYTKDSNGGFWKLTPEGAKKSISGQKTAEKVQEKIRGKFIFDDDMVLKARTFPLCKLNDRTFSYGLFLPKEEEIKHDGEIMGVKQVMAPVLVTSDSALVECHHGQMEREYKIQMNTPYSLPLAWSLKSIKAYLEGNKEKVNGKELFDRIKLQYEKYLYYREKEWYDIHALWDIGTYFFMLFSAFPIFEMRGIRGSAKTKTMKVSRKMALNSTDIMINPSEATLFRETDEKRPTKYIDEAEKLFTFNTKTKQVESDLRAELINSSYARGAVVPRQDKIKEKFVTVPYNTYSPTMIGSINGLYGATEDRAITHVMTRAPDSDKRGEMEIDNDEDDPVWQEIRNDLYVFGLQNWRMVELSYVDFDNQTKIRKRDLQVWKPILILAKVIDRKLYEKIKSFAEEVSEQKRYTTIPEGSLDFEILKTIAEIIKGNQRLIYIKDIHERIKFMENPPREKTISHRMTCLGFSANHKGKDMHGAFFEIPKDMFEEIVFPICPEAIEILNGERAVQEEKPMSDAGLDHFVKIPFEKKIDSLKKMQKGPKHVDFLKAAAHLTEEDIKKAAAFGIIYEVTPDMWEVV